MKVNYQNIYEKLGYLFYAVAAVDHNVHAAEVAKLRALISREWLPMENSIDNYGTDAAHYISISFEYLLNEGIPSTDAYTEFSDYYQEHSGAFSKELKKKISTTVSAIANAVAHRNKNEQLLIEQLHRLMR